MRRMIVAALWLAAQAGPLQWEVASGQWSGGPEAGTGRSAGIQPATVLSTDWYNDFEFTGEIDDIKRSSGLISILARYAGPTESYALVVDPARARIFIRENHYAESREAASTAVPVLASESRLRFRISA